MHWLWRVLYETWYQSKGGIKQCRRCKCNGQLACAFCFGKSISMGYSTQWNTVEHRKRRAETAPYSHCDRSPFQLAAPSQLSAIPRLDTLVRATPRADDTVRSHQHQCARRQKITRRARDSASCSKAEKRRIDKISFFFVCIVHIVGTRRLFLATKPFRFISRRNIGPPVSRFITSILLQEQQQQQLK